MSAAAGRGTGGNAGLLVGTGGTSGNAGFGFRWAPPVLAALAGCSAYPEITG